MAKVSTPAGIVAKIMAMLKLGEEGKIGSFFSRLETDFNRQIKAIRHNITAAQFEYEQQIEHLKERLQDAEAAVEDAWMNIKAEDVTTNAAQDVFKHSYLEKIADAEHNVERIKQQLEDAKDEHKEQLDDLNEQISKYEARLAKIKG